MDLKKKKKKINLISINFLLLVHIYLIPYFYKFTIAFAFFFYVALYKFNNLNYLLFLLFSFFFFRCQGVCLNTLQIWIQRSVNIHPPIFAHSYIHMHALISTINSSIFNRIFPNCFN